MRNKLKFALLAFFVAAVFVSSAGAANIVDVWDAAVTGPYNTRYVAYEVYPNNLGINADAVPVFIKNQGPVISNASKNLRVQNGKVNLSGQNVFLTTPVTNFTTIPTCTGTLAAFTSTPATPVAEYIIGESSASGVPSADITINVYDADTFCVRNGAVAAAADSPSIEVPVATSLTYLSVGLGNIIQASGVARVIVPDALNFNVDPNLNPSCTYWPTVNLAYIAQNETGSYRTILTIYPQFGGQIYDAAALNAELDTDNDFLTFVFPNAQTPNVTSATNVRGRAFDIINRFNTTYWKAFIDAASTCTVGVHLVSGNVEPGLLITQTDGSVTTACTTVDNITWSCSFTDIVSAFTTPTGTISFDITKTGPGELNPTAWTVDTPTLTCTNQVSQNTCFTPTGNIGVWFGGLEAFVPFVKGGNGYETTIKLYNRYNKDAKLYVKTFVGDSNPSLVATQQLGMSTIDPTIDLGFIPADGMIVIQSADIAALIPGYDISKGIPVKFLIRVPAQQGVTTSTGTYSGGHTSATLTQTNFKDPFVEGIVVSTFAGGGQRSIPLKFKTFKNGEYGH